MWQPLPQPVNVFIYSGQMLNHQLANTPQLTPQQRADGEERVRYLRTVGNKLDITSTDPALATALARAALDATARAEFLRGLLALEGFTFHQSKEPGSKQMAKAVQGLAVQLEELLR